jgi:hypothetical protein
MAVVVEMHNTGDPAIRSEIAAAIEHVLNDRVGDWKVSLKAHRRTTGGR